MVRVGLLGTVASVLFVQVESIRGSGCWCAFFSPKLIFTRILLTVSFPRMSAWRPTEIIAVAHHTRRRMACIPHCSSCLPLVPNSEVKRDLLLGFDKCDKSISVGELTGRGFPFVGVAAALPLLCSPTSLILQLGERTQAAFCMGC